MMLGIFSNAYWPFVYLLWRNVYSHPLPILKIELFIFLSLSCESSSCILDTSPLSDIRFADVFSHSVGCLFTLLMALFATQKFLALMKSTYLFFLLSRVLLCHM